MTFLWIGVEFCVFFFLFKQKTAYEMRISDWSSGVCSSDLAVLRGDYELTDDITLVSLNSYAHMSMDQRIDLDGTSLTNGDQSIRGRIPSFSTAERLTGTFGLEPVLLGVHYVTHQPRDNVIWSTNYYHTNTFFPHPHNPKIRPDT